MSKHCWLNMPFPRLQLNSFPLCAEGWLLASLLPPQLQRHRVGGRAAPTQNKAKKKEEVLFHRTLNVNEQLYGNDLSAGAF